MTKILRPNRYSIILTVVVFFVILYLPVSKGTVYPCQIPPCPVAGTTILSSLMVAIGALPGLIIGIIISYFLASAMTFPLKKRK